MSEHRGSEAVRDMIVRGYITREVSCDGKKRFRTYAYADRVARCKSDEFHVRQYAYACPFCGGFHLATEKPE